MAALLRRLRGAASVEDEREALRRLQQAAAQQLEAMKHELAERAGAVRERERELAAALAATPGRPTAPTSASELPERAALPSRQDAAERERIEERLAELHEAERMFLRTRDELSARSEAIAARERLLAERERELGEGDAVGAPPSLPELADLEVRLRKLESGSQSGDDSGSFAAGLESLRRRGTRRRT